LTAFFRGCGSRKWSFRERSLGLKVRRLGKTRWSGFHVESGLVRFRWVGRMGILWWSLSCGLWIGGFGGLGVGLSGLMVTCGIDGSVGGLGPGFGPGLGLGFGGNMPGVGDFASNLLDSGSFGELGLPPHELGFDELGFDESGLHADDDYKDFEVQSAGSSD